MQQPRWLLIMMAVFVAATLTWADQGYAQAQKEPRRQGATQGLCTGQGAGNPNCPVYSNTQTCPRSGACNNQAQVRRRTRGGATQTPAPSTPQGQNPTTQSGK